MEGELAATVTPNSGVIPRAVHSIFESLAANNFEDYSVKVSFLELYNEELADLLAEYEERPASSSSMSGGSSNSSSAAGMNGSAGAGSDNGPKELRIFEDPSGKKGMQVLNLEEVIVSSATDVFALLAKANKRRRVAETNMNARSSRSHYVFTISVSCKSWTSDGEDIIKTGKLYLVDCE
jgi:kinesin family protein 11